jgi:hypothetical protein
MVEKYLRNVGHREQVGNGYFKARYVYSEVDIAAIERTMKFKKDYECSLARRRVTRRLAKQYLANRSRREPKSS